MEIRKYSAFATGLFLLFLLVGCAAVSERHPAPLQISYDFESGVPDEWSWKRVYGIEGNTALGLFNSRNKRFTSGTRLRLTDIPEGAAVDLAFDLYLIGTWDSKGSLADRFQVKLKGGGFLLDLKDFPNRFRDREEKIPEGNTGFVKVLRKPRAYWRVRQSLSILPGKHAGGELTLVFKGLVTGRKTEFWAIDNVTVTMRGPGG